MVILHDLAFNSVWAIGNTLFCGFSGLVVGYFICSGQKYSDSITLPNQIKVTDTMASQSCFYGVLVSFFRVTAHLDG